MENAFRDITHTVNNTNYSNPRQAITKDNVVRKLSFEAEIVSDDEQLAVDPYLGFESTHTIDATVSTQAVEATFESTEQASNSPVERKSSPEADDEIPYEDEGEVSYEDEDDIRPTQQAPATQVMSKMTEHEEQRVRELIARWSSEQMEVLDLAAFASLSPTGQAVFLNKFEARYCGLNSEDYIEYDEYYAASLFEKAHRRSAMSIYLQHLHPNAIQVKDDKSFGADFTESIQWMTRLDYYGPRPYILPEADSQFNLGLDIDFTGFVTEALDFFKHMHLIFVPDLSPKGRMTSCKMKWCHKALHTRANTALGNVDDKYSVFIVFPNHSLYDTDVIRHFYENVILPGIDSSKQARVNPAVNDYSLMRSSKKIKDGHVYDEETLSSLQQQLVKYNAEFPENKPVFVAQYFGRKEGVPKVDQLEHLITEIHRRFRMEYVHQQRPGTKTMFYQDVALDISCTDKTNVTLFWTKAIYQALKDPFSSPLASLMRRNITEFEKDYAPDYAEDYKYPQAVEYPNFGIGSLSSVIIEWNRAHLLISKIKGYQKGSEEFRYDVPFTNCNHAMLGFPLEYAKSLLAGEALKSKCETLIKRLGGEAKMVKEEVHFKRARDLYNTLMANKAYGPRLEITLQNPTADDIREAHTVLRQFGSNCVSAFKGLMAAYQINVCPFETLRLSPLQAIETSTICSFIRCFTESIANCYYRVLHAVTKTTVSVFNEDWLRLLFLLQDQLAFLWTGSLQTLCHPTLFARYEQKDAVLQYGHFYIDPVLVPGGLDPMQPNFKLHIPVPSHVRQLDDLLYAELAEDDLRDDVLIIGIPRRFINQVFPTDRTEMIAMVEKLKMVMQSNDSVVLPDARTVGASLAAHLLNLFFKSLFVAAKLTTSEQKAQFLTALKGSDPTQISAVIQRSVFDAKIKVYDDGPSWTCEDFIDQVFPLQTLYKFDSSATDVSFNVKWHEVCGDIVNRMNEALNAEDNRQLGAIITKAQIQSNMKQLLIGMKLKWLPRINKSLFWGWKKEETKNIPQFNINPVHVVDNDQVALLITNGTVRRVNATIDKEQKLAVIKYRIYSSARFKQAKLKAEFFRQCKFLLLKEDPEEKHQVKNISNAQILRTGLFYQPVPRGPIYPCQDEVWQLYYQAYIVNNDPNYEFFAYDLPSRVRKYDTVFN